MTAAKRISRMVSREGIFVFLTALHAAAKAASAHSATEPCRDGAGKPKRTRSIVTGCWSTLSRLPS
jgi:hypothetical protein